MLVILKIIGLCGIYCISAKIGILKAKKYENRLNELKNIKNSIEIFRSKIEFTYSPIKEIFEDISQIIYKNNSNIFQETITNMENYDLQRSWQIAVENQLDLIQEDKENIKLFGKMLGKTDIQGQINEVNLISNNLDILIKKAENEKQKNYKLFKTLGSAIGIGICIILI